MLFTLNFENVLSVLHTLLLFLFIASYILLRWIRIIQGISESVNPSNIIQRDPIYWFNPRHIVGADFTLGPG
jgi:hypothetical protein